MKLPASGEPARFKSEQGFDPRSTTWLGSSSQDARSGHIAGIRWFGSGARQPDASKPAAGPARAVRRDRDALATRKLKRVTFLGLQQCSERVLVCEEGAEKLDA
jgi:hypothetical protein